MFRTLMSLFVICSLICIASCERENISVSLVDGLNWKVVSVGEDVGHIYVSGHLGHDYFLADTLRNGDVEIRLIYETLVPVPHQLKIDETIIVNGFENYERDLPVGDPNSKTGSSDFRMDRLEIVRKESGNAN